MERVRTILALTLATILAMLGLTKLEGGVGAGLGAVSYARDGQRFQYVNSPWDYYWHMVGHRVRVDELSRKLLEIAPESFPDVQPELLSEFIRFGHDESKLNPSQSFLDRQGYDRRRHPIASRLFHRIYGKDFSDQKVDRSRALLETRNELNAIDERVAQGFFRKKGISPEKARQYLLAEKVADSLDRSLDLVAQEEFGRIRGIPCSEYWKGKDDAVAALCARLEPHWPKVWARHPFEKYKAMGDQYRRRAPRSMTLPQGCVLRDLKRELGFKK
jgi:hypothetical protein